jgi:hypothetical protein
MNVDGHMKMPAERLAQGNTRSSLTPAGVFLLLLHSEQAAARTSGNGIPRQLAMGFGGPKWSLQCPLALRIDFSELQHQFTRRGTIKKFWSRVLGRELRLSSSQAVILLTENRRSALLRSGHSGEFLL